MTTGLPRSTAHHGLPAHEVVLMLRTDPRQGLTEREAAAVRACQAAGAEEYPAAVARAAVFARLTGDGSPTTRPRSNHRIVGGITVQVIAQAAITYLPIMNEIFRTAPISAQTWVRILVLAAAASVVVAGGKRLRRQPM